jgi:putative ABC transport system permease protein
MILFGLKSGLIDNLTQRLLENPANREIRAVGSGRFLPDWFAEMESREDVAFVIPRTRTIAATIFLRRAESDTGKIITADLIPTEQGDPLLKQVPHQPMDDMSVILSRRAADSLDIQPNAVVEGFVTRLRDGQRETARVMLDVVAVAPDAAFVRDGVFASLDLLLAVERYRDGFEVPELGWPGITASGQPHVFSSYRLFASTLDDVPVLSRLLHSQGLEVRTRAVEIEMLQSLNRNLTLIFWLLVSIGGTGYLMSLAAGLWATIQRKRTELCILRLLGLRPSSLAWFPLSHAMFTSTAGVVIASVVSLVVSEALNVLFMVKGAPGELVCRLVPEQLLLGALITISFAAVASLLPGYRSTLIEPADGLRQV